MDTGHVSRNNVVFTAVISNEKLKDEGKPTSASDVVEQNSVGDHCTCSAGECSFYQNNK